MVMINIELEYCFWVSDKEIMLVDLFVEFEEVMEMYF